MRRTVLPMIVLLFGSVSPTPLSAQSEGQTPESARRFLEIQIESGNIETQDDGAPLTLSLQFDAARPSDGLDPICKFYASVDYGSEGGRLHGRWYRPWDFRKSGATKDPDNDRSFRFLGNRYLVGSADLRERIVYAIEYLRQACDPAKATGF